MLNKIIGFSIHNKLIVGMLVLALVGFGAYNVTQLPIDAVPDITNNQVMVITTSPSLGAADIERLITFPVEQSTRNIPGIIEQRSFSRFGLSLVTIVFDDETDVYWARQQVSERLIELQNVIPARIGTPQMGPVTTGLGEIFQYVVKPKPGYEKEYDAMELRTIQDWIIRKQLLGTKGVADVSSFGGKLKQYEIAISPDKLKAHNISINDIVAALETNNQNTGGAYIEKGPVALFIRSEGLVTSETEIGNILIKTLPDGTPLQIKNVAEVHIGFATRYGAIAYNDEGEVAGGLVMMLKGGNSSQVIEDVKVRIDNIRKTLPEGVEIEPFLDRTKMVNNAIKTVETNLMEGALIVIFVLVLFLGNLRAGLLVASVIPLAMLFAIIMMNLFGVGGNLMSLGALDFGLIIDGAVIIVETVMHRLHHNKHFAGLGTINQQQMDEEVEHSAGKMMNAAVFGQIIILIVYLPILSLQGIEGKMFGPMAKTVAFAIIGAFILSLTYVPMMSALVLSKKVKTSPTISDKMMHWLEGIYEKSLAIALNMGKSVVVITVVTFALAVWILANMGGEFIPKLEEGDFAVETRVLTGSSLTTTVESTQKAAKVLLANFPEVEKVVTKIGSGEIPTDPMPVEAADLMIILKPKKEWTSAKSFDELAEKMGTALEAVPGVTFGFQYPVQMRFNELMTGARQDVVCKVFGDDLDSLAKFAESIGALATSVEGAKDIYEESVTGLPQIIVDYNRPALAQYGLSVEHVNKTLEAAFAGSVCGQVYENVKRFDLVVRMDESERKELSDVQNLLITTPTGEHIPLHQVARVEIEVGPNQIQRENAERRITVGFNVRGRDVQSVVQELQQKLDKSLKLPSGYYITYGGQFENLVAAKQRLAIAVPVSLLLILLLLYFAFSSLKQGLLIYTAIPLSAIGGIFMLWLRDMPFSISAGVGFIALFGVAVLNGIVLITEFNQLKLAGVHDVRTRILKGTRIRLRPVLMTAAVASLGFLPMAISNGAGAEVQRPLASVVIGGLVSATFLTLMVLPILYMWFETESKKHKNKAILPTIILLFVFASTALNGYSQSKLTYQQALDIALKQSFAVQLAALQTQQQQALEKSGFNLPQTNVNGEYGQTNSIKMDTRFTIGQSLAFPTVYVQQKNVLMAQSMQSQLNEEVVKVEIKKQVTQLYYSLALLEQKKALLSKADTLYATMLEKQTNRYNAGETNILEKTSAETQRQQIAMQLEMLLGDMERLSLQLTQLINQKELVEIDAETFKMELPAVPDTGAVGNTALLKWHNQEQQVALSQLKLTKSKLLPQFNLGYSNQSIIGYQLNGNTEVYYDANKRFSSVMAGVSIPLFFTADQAQIKSAKFQYSATQMAYAKVLSEEQTRLAQLKTRFSNYANQLAYYENTALKQADILLENAKLQFDNGAINYLEWTMLMNQAISLKNDYLNAVTGWNETLAEIIAFTN